MAQSPVSDGIVDIGQIVGIKCLPVISVVAGSIVVVSATLADHNVALLKQGPPMIDGACTPHICFQLDGLPIWTCTEYLPVVGLTALIPIRQHICCEDRDVSIGVPFKDTVAQLLGATHISITDGRDEVSSFSFELQ